MMNAELTATLRSAIEASSTENKIVCVDYAGSIAEVIGELSCISDKVDHARQDDGTYDVWGAYDDGIGMVDWRLEVTAISPTRLSKS